ncbi:MAG TPA: LapA family protein [Pseudoxanthomonas sp.]|nr:LapA family protein [Pseudoxanthomonas sp.]
MNVFRLIIALIFLGIGLLVGVLNTQPITLKLLITDIQTSSGVAIILSLLAGVIIGGLIVLATLVWPLYTKLRKANKQATMPVPPASTSI